MTLSIPIFLFFTAAGYSQEIPNATVTHDRYLGSNSNDPNDVSGVYTVRKKTQTQQNLENEILELKKEDNPANRERILQLNSQLENLTGYSSTKFTPYNGGRIVPAVNPNPPFLNDNINNIRIYNNTDRTIKGIATFTEQRGANTGRIWVVYAFSANLSTPDSIRVVYSDDGGSTWAPYANAWLGGTDKINHDDLDAEIVEPPSGDKFLWIALGMRASGGSGRWFTGGFVLNITSFSGGFFGLSWPGDNSAKRYYNIRITSDNAHYTTNSWIYLACSFDSLNTANVLVNTQKYARCLDPYTTSPSFSYQGRYFWWISSIDPPNYLRTLYTDIAYLRHGSSDSIIVSFSGVPDSTKIFFAKSDITGNPAAGNSSVQGGSEPSAEKQWTRIATNGYDNGSVICVFRQFYPANWNVKYFRTTDYGNFSSIFQSTLLGSPLNENYQPDIVGLRNKDKYYFAFNTIASTDSVHLIGLTTSGFSSPIRRVNYISLVSGTQGPKPGFRYVNNDSCFSIYSEIGPLNVWATLGCSGSVIGVKGISNQVPGNFALYQNYPNPFNPTTTIKYDVPVNGLVKLVVYDVLGRQISVLVNEVKNPGSYSVNFDAENLPSGVYFYKLTAGSFASYKKMLLVK
jgi:hypothetical protein